VYLTPPLKGFPWNWVSAQGSEETRMMGLPNGRKSFKIGQAASQPRCRIASTRHAYLRRAVKMDKSDTDVKG